MLEPRHALPRRRPRICLRYLTFFGINIDLSCLAPSRASDLGQAQPVLRPRHALQLALVDPHLHADLPVGRAALGKPVVDVGAQRVQRQRSEEVPFGARDLGAAQPADTRIFTPLAPKRMADSIAFFMARRKATRRSICKPTDSATSCASSSGLWISMMLMKISRPVFF